MNVTSLAARIRDWKSEIQQAMAVARSEPHATDWPEWYAGLAVSPASFSRQLGQMQVSILRASTPLMNQAEADHAESEHVAVSARRS